MSGVRHRGGASIAKLKSKIAKVGVLTAQEVSAQSAVVLTAATKQAFASGVTVYGEARPVGRDGALTLVKSGATRDLLRFVSQGSVLRAALTRKYMRYLIGKYGVLPNGRAAMPTAWRKQIKEVFFRVAGEELGGL